MIFKTAFKVMLLKGDGKAKIGMKMEKEDMKISYGTDFQITEQTADKLKLNSIAKMY